MLDAPMNRYATGLCDDCRVVALHPRGSVKGDRMRHVYVCATILYCILLTACGGDPAAIATARITATRTGIAQATVVAQVTQTGIAQRTTVDRATQAASNQIALADMERQWRALNITNYRITHAFDAPTTVPSSYTISVLVQNGIVVPDSIQCDKPDYCTQVSKRDLTVEGIFTEARREIASPYCVASTSYHPQYRFPSYFGCTPAPNVADYVFSRSVTAFSPSP